ncbi:pilus assembly protein TadG-related protein [Streptomyces sp. NPDC060334]|uniref:pilus assembly protein TadG-related protein n=1 Tax=Streptomyces sp. NPDC060334 TaxID=3347099 RepID=UPI0036591D4E
MIEGSTLGDRGQAFPIYVVLVAGLLFAALAFFVVGMAGDTRSSAQGAADAAALAAARDARDALFGPIDMAALTPADWEEILQGDRLKATGACAAAVEFAGLNDASAECVANIPEFTVKVNTNGTVGDSVIPGTASMHGKATAKAIIEPRCTLGPAPTPAASQTPSPGAESPGEPTAVALKCKDGSLLTLDPLKPGSLLQLSRKLFSVRLVD